MMLCISLLGSLAFYPAPEHEQERSGQTSYFVLNYPG